MRPSIIKRSDLAKCAKGQVVAVLGGSYAAAKVYRNMLTSELRHAQDVVLVSPGAHVAGRRFSVVVVGDLSLHNPEALTKWLVESFYTRLFPVCVQLVVDGIPL